MSFVDEVLPTLEPGGMDPYSADGLRTRWALHTKQALLVAAGGSGGSKSTHDAGDGELVRESG